MKLRYLILALLTIIFWGLSLLATRALLSDNFTPNGITFIRFLIPVILMLFILPGKELRRIKKPDLKYFLLMALGGTTLFYFFENSALKYTSVANTALITASIPLFTLLTATIFIGKKILWQNLIGIVLGLVGTFILFYQDLISGTVHLKGDLLVLISVFMWIIYSFSYRKVMHKYQHSVILYYTFLFGVIFLIPIIILELPSYNSVRIDFVNLGYVLFLSIFCSLLGYYFWNIAIRNLGVKLVSNLILLIPLVSITAGILFLQEKASLYLIVSTFLIITGAYLASFNTPEAAF